mgnify:CR=1 FL=1
MGGQAGGQGARGGRARLLLAVLEGALRLVQLLRLLLQPPLQLRCGRARATSPRRRRGAAHGLKKEQSWGAPWSSFSHVVLTVGVSSGGTLTSNSVGSVSLVHR